VTIKIAGSYSSPPVTTAEFGLAPSLKLTFQSYSYYGMTTVGGITSDDSGNGSGLQIGFYNYCSFTPTLGALSTVGYYGNNAINAPSTKTITNAYGSLISLPINLSGTTGTVTNAYTLSLTGPAKSAGTLTTGYALYVSKGSGGTNNWTAYFDENIGVGVAPVSGVGIKIAGNNPIRIASVGTNTGTTAVVDSNGDLVKTSSSIRYKENVIESKLDSSLIYNLVPVQYNYISTGSSDFGLIAEEVEKQYPELINYDIEGNPESVKYDRISLLLISEIKLKCKKGSKK
jgi:hypothetical protein